MPTILDRISGLWQRRATQLPAVVTAPPPNQVRSAQPATITFT